MLSMNNNLEINGQFQDAYEAMERGSKHIFLTGKAGTGKSTLLRYFRERTRRATAVVAPTGVAAVNIDGQTIHSFFKLRPGASVEEARHDGRAARKDRLFQKLETIVIDEVSMVRADLMDCIDAFLQAALKSKARFGGKRLVMIGDLHQLPPIVRGEEAAELKEKYKTPFFFSSEAIRDCLQLGMLEYIELDKIYRQTDERFIEILNAVRCGKISERQLAELNMQYDPEFSDESGKHMHLMAVNAQADQHNETNLERLSGKTAIAEGKIKGEFKESELPTDLELRLKPGARVMLVNNDSQGRWVNGTLATVLEVRDESVDVKLDNGEAHEILPYTWNKAKTKFNADSGELSRETLGSFTQFPLRLAWATTIHKSQGKTFDRVVIDLGRGAFAAGQSYVALSRCRTLDGITLKRPIRRSDLIMDARILDFSKEVGEKRGMV
jgi:ATP-dependent exoDNAse (exonuclease V) alpha subunit